jgi:hypothetical protein
MPVTGYLGLTHKAETVGDLRDLLIELDHWQVPDDALLELGTFNGQHVYVVLADEAMVEVIECGNHYPLRRRVDALIMLHDCEVD